MMRTNLYLIFYYLFVQYLPANRTKLGRLLHTQQIRYYCCKHIFNQIGNNVNIERKANFGYGTELEIGDNSGLGINSIVPSNIKIGKNVMMGPNCCILNSNHIFDRIDIPMIEQGSVIGKRIIIEDDVWIGQNVIMTAGRHISKGSVIGAGCLLCKDFPEYSIVGGNPSKLIRSRLQGQL